MFLKKRRASTDPRLRSLLQKAARRGYPGIVRMVAQRLFDIGDRSWLRSRAVIITFEECWPLASRLAVDRDLASKMFALENVAIARKNKDAAGLGSLAYAYSTGDLSALEVAGENSRSVKIVAQGLSRPAAFFDWIKTHQLESESADVRIAAREYFSAATWPWDRACILAGAYLGTTTTPDTGIASTGISGAFPYWVALDKHTDEGKRVLRRLSSHLGATYRQLIWTSFYFESALTNSLSPSLWWERERVWRLKRCGLSMNDAEKLWGTARPLVEDALMADAMRLEADLRDMPSQHRLT